MSIEIWILYGIGAGLVFGLADVLTKSALRDREAIDVVLGAFVWAALFWAPLVALRLAGEDAFGLDLGTCAADPTVHALLVAKAALLVGSSLAAFHAVKALPITVSSALRATGPLFVLAGSLAALGLTPDPSEIAGIVLGVLSIYLYAFPAREDVRRDVPLGSAALMVAAVGAAAASLVLDKALVGEIGMNPRSVQFHADLYRLALAASVFGFAMRRRLAASVLFAPAVVATGLLMSLGEFVYFNGVEVAGSDPAALSVLRKCSLFVAFAAGVFVFREGAIARKALALTLLVLALVSLAYEA